MPDVLKKNTFLLLNAEPELDCADPRAALQALSDAEFVVQLYALEDQRSNTPTCYCRSRRSPRPRAPSSTSRAARRAFTPRVNALGDARPGWKVLRVLGSLLGTGGASTSTPSTRCARPASAGRTCHAALQPDRRRVGGTRASDPQGIQRIADVPIVLRRPAGAPLAAAAEDQGSAAARAPG